MILGGYGFEILVNDNIPLREYSEAYETSKEQITTTRSYIQDISTNKCYESDKTVFVAVPKPGMKFSIRIWADSAKKKTYRVHIYIDGTWDHVSYTLTDTHSTKIEYFIDESGKKKYNFIFASSIWTDDESKVNNIKENNIYGYGSVIVEFFEAKWTLKENENPSYTVVKESNVSNGLSYHTQFEEAPLTDEERPIIKRAKDRNNIKGTPYYGWKSVNKPSAVLVLHYRPKTWLKLRGLTPDPFYTRSSPEPFSESDNDEDTGEFEDDTRELEDEIEKGRENLRKRSRVTNGHDDKVSNRRRKNTTEEFNKDQITLKKVDNLKPESIRNNDHKTFVNNRFTEKCDGKKVNSKSTISVSNTSKVKFARYFEEIIEEAKFIDIEVGSNQPTEETIQNKKIREIIEILDSDDEV